MTITTAAPTRNKQVSGALKSSDNGGQFACKQQGTNDISLAVPVELPRGAQFIPDPSPGQTMFDGSPAPDTFAEAWQQTFRPLATAEQRVGMKLNSSPTFMRVQVLDRGADITGLEFGRIKDRVVSSDDEGDVLELHLWNVPKERGECVHDEWSEFGYVEVDEDDCTSLTCECFHCVMENIEEVPSYLGEQNQEDSDRIMLKFRMADGVAAKASEVFDQAIDVQALISLRQQTVDAPWKILSPVGNQDPETEPEYAAAAQAASEAEQELVKYSGLESSGKLNYREKIGDLAEEVQSIDRGMYAVRTVTIPGKSYTYRATDEEINEFFKSEHEAHQQVKDELSLMEKMLGRPVLETVSKSALETHRKNSESYVFGVLKGAKRRDEILENRSSALRHASDLLHVKYEEWRKNKSLENDGKGWPEGTFAAPNRNEWRELCKPTEQ